MNSPRTKPQTWHINIQMINKSETQELWKAMRTNPSDFMNHAHHHHRPKGDTFSYLESHSFSSHASISSWIHLLGCENGGGGGGVVWDKCHGKKIISWLYTLTVIYLTTTEPLRSEFKAKGQKYIFRFEERREEVYLKKNIRFFFCFF